MCSQWCVNDEIKQNTRAVLFDDAMYMFELKGGHSLKPPTFEHIFVAVITFSPFFCADTFITSLLLIVCGLR